MTVIEKILKLFLERGDSEYGGEGVNQREHALQCATLAEHAGASEELITASLLHDIGHLVHALPDDAPEQGIDDRHEELGNRFLKSMFPMAVSEPVRLHVDAKRYLCAIDKSYISKLSAPSLISLHLQGGPMEAPEIEAYERCPYGLDAAMLRRWDDLAKIPSLETPDIQHFIPYIQSCLKQKSNSNHSSATSREQA